MDSKRIQLHRRIVLGPLLSIGIGLTLAGCLSSGEGERAPQTQVAAAITVPSHIGPDKLIGRWGIASFHNEKDRKRTETQASAGCSQPYVITKGAQDGVMMHVADDPKLYELRLKAGPGGRTYLGFEAPPGDLQDREILSATDSMLVMRFVDPDAHRRYGTFIYVRCR
ncbi:hypothetical protein [Bosea vaviloviae]|uniref:hypothetical protein n=1 Tax=Bosea vaviloviae TaxID=1526658 RepID=UPI0009EC73AD|nr:hypothetical protein [Bosea vaviloviae]